MGTPNLFSGRNKAKSLTLIEIIIAVLILTSGLVMILKSFLYTSRAFEYSRNKLAVSFFIESKLAQYRNNCTIGRDGSGDFVFNSKDFRWKAEESVVFEEDKELTGIKLVALDVAWNEGVVSKSQNVTAYLACRD